MAHKASRAQPLGFVVRRNQRLPDKITCGICRQNFISLSACTEHMKLHHRARAEHSQSKPSSSHRIHPSSAPTTRNRSSDIVHCGQPPVPATGLAIRDLSKSSHLERRPQTAINGVRKEVVFREGASQGGVAPPPKSAPSSSSGCRDRQTGAPPHTEGASPKSSSPTPADQHRKHACFRCQMEFPDVQSLRGHCRAHGGSMPYSCTHCKRTFALYSSLMTHEKIHSPHCPRTHRCKTCGAMFLHESSLKAHQRRHEDAEDGPVIKPYQCSYCHEWLSNEGSLKIHMQRHETFQTPSACSVCGTSFSDETILKAHQKLHQTESTTRCVICMRHFKRSRMTLRHSDVHADDRQNVCDTCEKRFPKVGNSSWRRMQLLLPENRKFYCLYCDAAFSRLSLLVAHESGHREPPPGFRDNQCAPVVIVA